MMKKKQKKDNSQETPAVVTVPAASAEATTKLPVENSEANEDGQADAAISEVTPDGAQGQEEGKKTAQVDAADRETSPDGVDTPEEGEGKKKEKKPLPPVSKTLACIIWLMRIVVGSVFVFSGFVKAVDPWGNVYKFTEYISALGWDSFSGLTVFGAFALPAFEFVLGVLLVTGCYRRVAPVLAGIFMLCMTPLTLWLAVSDAVPDCGCFGDFIVTSNWVTFFKNVMLLGGTIYLIIYSKRVKPLYGPAVQWIVVVLSFVLPLLISMYGYITQPLLDFRPYKVGTTITTKASSVDDSKYVFIYKKDGVEREFSIDNVPDDDSGWEFVNRYQKEDSVATHDDNPTLAVWDNDDDVSDELLSNEKLLMLLIPDMEKAGISYSYLLNGLNNYSSQHGVAFVCITTASDEQIAEWEDLTMSAYPIYNADDSEIKMIARGNPAIVYVQNSKVVWKRTLASLDPDVVFDGEKSVEQFSDDMHPDDLLRDLIVGYLALMFVLLLLNRTHVVIRHLRHKNEEQAPQEGENQENAEAVDGETATADAQAEVEPQDNKSADS